VLALLWLVTLVTGPWNLYFAARRAAASMAVSREQGIDVRPANDAAAAGRLSRWMLRFALGAHAGTALAAAAIAYATETRPATTLDGISDHQGTAGRPWSMTQDEARKLLLS
jgi:hypothetical protein